MSTNKNTSTSPSSGDSTIYAVMCEIENKTEKKLDQLMKPVANSNPIEKIQFVSTEGTSFGDKLLSIMKEGDAEFKEKVGRPMTYSEMRMMYG
jgi:hypothetical protein